MPLDPEIAALLEREKAHPPRSSLTVEQTRERMLRARGLAGEPPQLHRVDDVAGGRMYWPSGNENLPLVVFFHGGRFFSGNLDTHDTLCRRLALEGGCRILAVDYRLAPEHRFPAAVEDAYAALERALRTYPVVAVAGDSAGANLAAVASLSLRDPALRCQLLLYPMIDATCSLPSHREFATGYGPGSADMLRGWNEYLPPGHDPRDWRVSPLYAEELAGLPSTFVLTAEYDSLRDEGEAFAARLHAAGVPVQLRRYSGAIHGFVQHTGTVRLARKAVEEAGGFLREALAI